MKSTRRRMWARRLLKAGRAALPTARHDWAEAMDHEVSSIADDRAALRWAFGCFLGAQKVGLRAQLRNPSAMLPLLMSIAALGMVLGHFALYGIVTQTDEGTPAHVFQLLMVAQLPFIAIFMVRWLPRVPGPALQVLALQAAAACAAITAVLCLT